LRTIGFSCSHLAATSNLGKQEIAMFCCSIVERRFSMVWPSDQVRT
jgi:hypothetical protein